MLSSLMNMFGPSLDRKQGIPVAAGHSVLSVSSFLSSASDSKSPSEFL